MQILMWIINIPYVVCVGTLYDPYFLLFCFALYEDLVLFSTSSARNGHSDPRKTFPQNIIGTVVAQLQAFIIIYTYIGRIISDFPN